ncbi:MAG: hypothetical protein ACUVYA_07400 [Planctomycetota bacterium]
MRKLTFLGVLGAFLGCPWVLWAAEKRILCDVNDPQNKCPGADCICVSDSIEIVFDSASSNVLEYPDGQAFPLENIGVTVYMDTKSSDTQGWSYGVIHDLEALDVLNATTEGTDAREKFGQMYFDATSYKNIQRCVPGTLCRATEPGERTDGGGWISGVVLSLTTASSLDTGKKNSLAKAVYTLKKDVGPDGTKIEFSDRVAPQKSPATALNLTVNGKSRVWTEGTDGLIKKAGGAQVEICNNGVDDDGDQLVDCADPDCAEDPACRKENCTNGVDDDGDQLVDCADPDCAEDPACQPSECEDYALYFGPAATTQTVNAGDATEVPITCRNKLAALAFQLGVKRIGGAAPYTWEFSGALGADQNRIIELIITDANGDSQTPKTPNKGTTNSKDPTEVKKGAAVAAFTGDFFAVDLAPALGGPGFTAGYLADLDPSQGGENKIPATGQEGQTCLVNEILKIVFGAPPVGEDFSRGDADGNKKINISDAVLIIQNIVGNLPKRFDCDDMLDANDDGVLNVADAIPVLNYVFQRNPLGPPLPEPFKPNCAKDRTADALTCKVSNCK